MSVSEGVRIGIIVGAVCALVVIAIIILVILYCKRKKRKAQSRRNVYVSTGAPVAHYPQSFSASQPNSKTSQSSSHRSKLTDSQTQNTPSLEKVQPVFQNGSRHANLSTTNNYDATSAVEFRHRSQLSDITNSSVPSSMTGPLAQARPQIVSYNTSFEGIENPVFNEEGMRGNIDRQSSRSQGERRRNRMDSSTAAAIAAEKDRRTSVFNIADTDNLIDNDSVIVFDQRTAL